MTVVNRALHFLDQSKLNSLKRSYRLNIPIPKYILNDNYPADPKTFGERLRKARMDAGLLIREFAALIGVTAETVINWKLRGMKPWKKAIRRRVEIFIKN